MKIKAYDYRPIGERIKKARESKGYRQNFLAEKIGKTDKYISALERGLSGLSMSALMDICTFLEVEADYILFGKKSINNYDNKFVNEVLQTLTIEQVEEMVKMYISSLANKK